MNKLFIALGAVVLIVGLMYMSYSNKEVRAAENIHAQQKVTRAFFDEMWKILQTQAGVADEYKEAFKEIYPDLIKGRYSNERGGALMSWVTEHNPEFDASLYKKLMTSIEAQRTRFFEEQQMLIDLEREHKTMRKVMPGSWFIGSRPDVEITIIESEKTESIFKTGQENDVDLFKRDK